MSYEDEGTPYWAPTRSEIQTWQVPTGVSRGRGFVPAGRGRGIAKWSSATQDDGPVGRDFNGRNGRDSINGRDIMNGRDGRDGRDGREGRGGRDGTDMRNRYKGDNGSGFRKNDADMDGRYESVPFRDSSTCYKCEGIGHLAYECPSRDKYQREEGRSERPRRREPGKGEGNSNYQDENNRFREKNHERGEGGRTDSFSCYKCNGEGHIARNCPVREDGRAEDRTRIRAPKGEECYTCGEIGHIARNCPEIKNGETSHSQTGELDEDLFQHGVSSGINFDNFDNIDVKVTGTDVRNKVGTFESAELDQVLLNNIKKSKYVMPTPVQKHAIPNILAGRDMMACAQTGSGKTAAFLIPVIHLLIKQGVGFTRCSGAQAPEVIVISPTRELASQIKKEAQKFCLGSKLRAVVAHGGKSLTGQAESIKDGCNILTATPGRLLDFIDRGVISLANVKFLVLDEADRMLDMGFRDAINKMVRNPDMPSKKDRQTLMFSATFPDDIQRMASEFLDEYLFLSVGIVGGACRDVTQFFHQVSQFEKREKLVEVIQNIYDSSPKSSKTLVFVEMKKTADFIASYMCQSGFPTTSIHGDREQLEREEALDDFKSGRKPVLVATSVAARGLDIKNVELVINYDLPKSIDDYVHRIGRTGRLGNTGRAISFFDAASDSGLSVDLVRILADAQQEVPDWLVEDAQRNPARVNGSKAPGFGGKDVRAQSQVDWN